MAQAYSLPFILPAKVLNYGESKNKLDGMFSCVVVLKALFSVIECMAPRPGPRANAIDERLRLISLVDSTSKVKNRIRKPSV